MLILRAGYAEIGRRGLGILQRVLGFKHKYLNVDSGVIERLCPLQRLRIGGYRVVQDFLQRILATDLEECNSQSRLFGKPFVLEIGGTQLSVVLLLVDGTAPLPPK